MKFCQVLIFIMIVFAAMVTALEKQQMLRAVTDPYTKALLIGGKVAGDYHGKLNNLKEWKWKALTPFDEGYDQKGIGHGNKKMDEFVKEHWDEYIRRDTDFMAKLEERNYKPKMRKMGLAGATIAKGLNEREKKLNKNDPERKDLAKLRAMKKKYEEEFDAKFIAEHGDEDRSSAGAKDHSSAGAKDRSEADEAKRSEAAGISFDLKKDIPLPDVKIKKDVGRRKDDAVKREEDDAKAPKRKEAPKRRRRGSNDDI